MFGRSSSAAIWERSATRNPNCAKACTGAPRRVFRTVERVHPDSTVEMRHPQWCATSVVTVDASCDYLADAACESPADALVSLWAWMQFVGEWEFGEVGGAVELQSVEVVDVRVAG